MSEDTLIQKNTSANKIMSTKDIISGGLNESK